MPALSRPGALGAIGSTPLVRLERLPGPRSADVWVKLEAANPTGSYKDRMALAMIEGAERDGRLQPGQTVVEYTGGSTGSSLAFVCAVKGYPLRIVSSNAFAAEKLATIAAFGAELEIIDSPEGITPALIPRMMERAREIVATEGGFATDQFNNHDSLDGYRTIGDEIARQLGGREVHAYCGYVGTAGCFMGTTAALRDRWPAMQRVVVEPTESAVISGGPPGTHRIEGGGAGFVPPLLAADAFDAIETVSTHDAISMARRAAREEGVFSGPSAGANLVAALGVAERLGPDHVVVTIQPDSGLKYLAGEVYRR